MTIYLLLEVTDLLLFGFELLLAFLDLLLQDAHLFIFHFGGLEHVHGAATAAPVEVKIVILLSAVEGRSIKVLLVSDHR